MPPDGEQTNSTPALGTLTIPKLTAQPPTPIEQDTGTLASTTSTDTASLSKIISHSQTDTESESGYASTQSMPVEDPGRLSVFSRRPVSKSADGEKRTMTIETETVANVSSIAGFKSDHRSLKTKASTDTVKATQKPKRKKSRVAVTNTNHIPTKSEIFAATITQAVDENEGSDSDETFVYESNPRSPKRLSRSPSISSMHSFDRRIPSKTEGRYSQGLHHLDDRDREKLQKTHAISGKRSMKFANNPYEEDHPRRHVSAAGRHGSMFLDPSNTLRSPKMRPSLERRVTSPHSSGPTSPRVSQSASPRNSQQRHSTTKKKKETTRPWNVYEEEPEPSERSPFLQRKSSYRQRRSRQETTWSGLPFIMAIVCLMLVVLMVGAAVLSTSQPLRDVKVVDMTNVLVSKQELFMDLEVEAYNPNALAINVNEVELSVFARSPYVRESQAWPWPGNNDHYPDDEDSTTLLLGRIQHLDSTLTFESRFFNRSISTSRGELRLPRPGSGTDGNGVETWNRVIQHSFDLIVRGVMKYRASGVSHGYKTAELKFTKHINPAIDSDSE